jgi:hypothetical protein
VSWHLDWPSVAFGVSGGFVIAILLLALLRAVAEVDMVPRYPCPEKIADHACEFCAEEGAHPEAGG